MSRLSSLSLTALFMVAISVQAAPTVTTTEPVAASATNNNGQAALAASSTTATPDSNTLASQLRPSNDALSEANQELLSRNAQLQRQVNDLQTQVNVLVYESKGQLFLYGAFTVLISLLVGIFISWLVFIRRQRW